MMTKVLVLILSSVMVAETADNYAHADRKNQGVLKNITSRRDDSLTLDKVGSEDKVLYKVGERFNKSNRDVYTTNDGSWIFGLKVRDGSRFENHAYNIYVVAGKTLILRSWSLNNTILSLSIKKGDIVRVNVSFNGSMYKSDVDKRNRLKINITERKMSLILAKVGKEDEGQYEMEESINKGVGYASTREDGAWRFHVNVLESHEIMQGNIGERIIILQINKPTTSFPRLFHNDKLVTVLGHDDCDVSSKSPFSGRLKCEDDKVMKRYSIEIQNLAQKDVGLYRVNIDGSDTDRCFLNITEKCSTVTSRWTTVNINPSSEGNYDKASTESSSSANTSNMWNVLIYIIPTVSATVVVMMIMMICCHVLLQRRNAHNFEAGIHFLGKDAYTVCEAGICMVLSCM
ncbi:hypothetical protein CHS0354_007123 [Potamilus streckersoni]|uniref:Uncharacterized protein n=1 Tax=Potamilus streckersoni TaxID=2493646 RepID=A0AAE0T240_9BIVA|nr:hypothetical protein CHS0354_007123 [Potamilus streckersoni]